MPHKDVDTSSYFKVSPLMIFPETLGKFSVYLKQKSGYVLYAGEDEPFTERHKMSLFENGVDEVFVQAQHKDKYEAYVEENLGTFLANDVIPLKERASVFYSTSNTLVQEVFAQSLPESISLKYFDRIAALVRNSMELLTRDDMLKTMAEFISHDYYTYTHSVQVFVYSASILAGYGLDDETLMQCGLGALLHDVGKTRLPDEILNKKGALTSEERTVINTHPLQGVAMCTQIPLQQEAINCILFHHERVDGTGYPSGITGEYIPLPAKVVTVCDVYDALTSNRVYADSVSPFKALQIMRDEMDGAFDMDVFKRLIAVLSGAAIV